MRLLQLHTVIVAHDLTDTSDAALRTAAAFAAGAGAAVHVAHVAPPSTEMIAHSGRRAEFVEEIHAATARAGVTAAFTPHVLEGPGTPEALAALADRISADVIITGRRRNRDRVPVERPIGGTAYAIITRSRVSCLVVTDPLVPPLRRTLVGIDCSEAARGALLTALSWSSALRARDGQSAPMLTALHVHESGSRDQEHWKRTVDHELDVLRRNAGDWAGVVVSGITRPGADAASEIAAVASDLQADLVVLGTRGLGAAAAGTLGSVSASVLGRLAGKPVLLVPPAVWRDHARRMDYLE